MARVFHCFLALCGSIAQDAPPTWSAAMMNSVTEEEATDLLQDVGWPLSWLSDEHVQSIVSNGWLELVEHIAMRAFQKGDEENIILSIDAALRIEVDASSPKMTDINFLRLQSYLWPVVKASRGPPRSWQHFFANALTEQDALGLLKSTSWPIAWLSEEHIDTIVRHRWWALIDNITNAIALDCKDDDTEKEARITSKMLETSLQRPSNQFEARSDKVRVLRLLLSLSEARGVSPKEPLLWTSIFGEASEEHHAIQLLTDLGWPVQWLTASQIKLIVSRSWWALAAQIVQRGVHETFFLAKADPASTHAATKIDEAMRTSVGVLRLEVEKLNATLDPNHGRPPITRPAVQWAQGLSIIHMNIKYAARFNAPGALRVENLNVNISSLRFVLSADGEHSGIRKRYELDLDLFDAVNVTGCSWSSGSVGKLGVTLAKDRPGRWARLLKRTEKIANIQIWHDFQEKLNREFDSHDE